MPPLILCWWRLISPRAPESNVFPPKKKIYPLLMILNVRNPTYFSPCFLGLTFFHATWVHWNSAYADFFIFLLPFQFTKNYLLSLNFTRSHFDQARILLVNHMAFLILIPTAIVVTIVQDRAFTLRGIGNNKITIDASILMLSLSLQTREKLSSRSVSTM